MQNLLHSPITALHSTRSCVYLIDIPWLLRTRHLVFGLLATVMQRFSSIQIAYVGNPVLKNKLCKASPGSEARMSVSPTKNA